MSIPETVLIFVGAPAAIVGAITLAVLGPSELRAPSRYRPGRPWPHEAAWFVPHPDAVHAVEPTSRARAELSTGRAAVTAGEHDTTVVGGATGEW